MSDNTNKRSLVAAVGAALAGSMILAGHAQAFEKSFSVKQLDAGYMQLAMKEGSCGGNKSKEGSCGGNKSKEGSCGGDKAKEGSCGGSKAKEGSCGGDKAGSSEGKSAEGKCGEGKCGAGK
jgi:uncharacterized low-complexity protein